MKRNSLQLTAYSLQQKEKILLVTSYLLLVTVFIGCAKREIKNLDSKGKNIICFGDSITWGYGAGPSEDFPSALAKLIDIPVINAGIDGDVSSEGIKRLGSDVLDRDPLLVIIEFGGNDFLRKIPKEVTLNNIKEMVEKIQAKGAMVAIVDLSAGSFLKEYRVAFQNVAKEKGAIFIPSILSGIVTNPSMKSDFIHPNANGYKVIAQKIYLTIKPYLKNPVSK